MLINFYQVVTFFHFPLFQVPWKFGPREYIWYGGEQAFKYESCWIRNTIQETSLVCN